MAWKTILVPHDFSSSANHAAAVARDEAKAHGATLVLLHVIELPMQLQPNLVILGGEEGAPMSVKDYAIANAEAHLRDLSTRLAADLVTATPHIRFGSTVEEILRFVDEHHIDLIVMGTHGRTGVRALIAGSVAERVVRAAPVPVLTVRQLDT